MSKLVSDSGESAVPRPLRRATAPAHGGEPIIALEDVHKWFGKLHVLRGIALKVWPGEVVVVAGP